MRFRVACIGVWSSCVTRALGVTSSRGEVKSEVHRLACVRVWSCFPFRQVVARFRCRWVTQSDAN